ncbi:Na-translocating system protein MpsC family protein [Pseudogracilibacillus sp. SO10305]|uniref:Na-translocating system protein MpsC family protein n=1 Tax=Pseudogracilibacillus sp. SO10305 TaxID=3098292 RepID=UPI00300DCF26
MMKEKQSFQLDFSNFVNAYVKNIGGKGPKETEVRVTEDTIIYYLRGILTNREKILMETPEGKNVVLESRRLFMEQNKNYRLTQFEQFIGTKIIENFESWNLEADVAICVLRLEEKVFC